MKRLLLVLGLAVAATASEDGAAAPPDRWTHPRGPASCSAVSTAWPPESFGGFRWTWKPRDAIAATPLTWDGAVFVLDGSALVALDARTGKEWARIAVKDPGGMAVGGRSVFLLEGKGRLVQYLLEGETFRRGWSYEGGAGAAPPRVIDDEIYLLTPRAILSLRAGLSRPAWTIEGNFVGEPAVRGEDVYALRKDGEQLTLVLLRREDGRERLTWDLGPRHDGGRLVVGNHVLAVEAGGEWILLGRDANKDGVQIKSGHDELLDTEPFAGDQVLLALTRKPRAWTILRPAGDHQRMPLMTEKERPELFEGAAACVWLGESSQCFGTWCGDVNSNAIFWHVSERPEGKPFAKGVRFPAVPLGDECVLLVTADGKLLAALEPEKIG